MSTYYRDDSGRLTGCTLNASNSSHAMWFYYNPGSTTPDSLVFDGSRYLYRKDAQGDIIGILDASGNLVARYVYDSWGNCVYVYDANGKVITDGNNIGNVNPLRYRGYEYDTETRLYYAGSRYYDPITGRFLNADAVVGAPGDLTGENLFAYCRNNPVNKTDSTGMWCPEGDGRGEYHDANYGFISKNDYDNYKHSTSSSGSAKSQAVNNAKTYGQAGADAGLGAVATQLKETKCFKQNSNGYFNSYLKYGKEIKAIKVAGYVVDGGIAAYDSYNILSNNRLSIGQKIGGTAIAVGGFAAGFGVGWLAVTAANCWNPVGWGMGLAFVTFAGVSVFGSLAVNSAQDYLYHKAGIK